MWLTLLKSPLFNVSLSSFKKKESKDESKNVSLHKFLSMFNRCKLSLHRTLYIINRLLQSYLSQIHSHLWRDLQSKMSSHNHNNILSSTIIHRKYVMYIFQMVCIVSEEVNHIIEFSSYAIKAFDNLLTSCNKTHKLFQDKNVPLTTAAATTTTTTKKNDNLFGALLECSSSFEIVSELTSADRNFSIVRDHFAKLLEALNLFVEKSTISHKKLASSSSSIIGSGSHQGYFKDSSSMNDSSSVGNNVSDISTIHHRRWAIELLQNLNFEISSNLIITNKK